MISLANIRLDFAMVRTGSPLLPSPASPAKPEQPPPAPPVTLKLGLIVCPVDRADHAGFIVGELR